MSADFSDQEIEQAVEQIVRQAIRRPYGALGQRSSGVTFQDFQEQTIAVLTLTPNAPFYVVRLGTERLVTVIQGVADTLEQLDDAVISLGRPTQPVVSITALSNARVAADALAQAGQARTQGFGGIERTPAFQRLDRNIQQFLNDASAPNLRRGGAIVRTAQEARGLIPGLVAQLKAARAILIQDVQYLGAAITDYEALDLPALLSSGVVERAAQVLEDATNQLASLTPESRVEALRSVTINILAARAVIRNFGSLRTPTIFVVIDGQGQPFGDAQHPTVPAQLIAEFSAPYATQVNSAVIANQLDLLIDGTFRTVVTLGGSFVAEMKGVKLEPFEVVGTPDPAQNDELEVLVIEPAGTTTLLAPLTLSATRTAQEVCTDINAGFASPKVEAVVALQPLKFQDRVVVAGTDPAAITITLTNPFSSWVAITMADGDLIHVLDGLNLGNIYQVNAGGVAAQVLTCTRITGTGTLSEPTSLVEAGGPSLTVAIKIRDSYAGTALANRSVIQIGSSTDIRKRAAVTLGFTPGARTTCQSISADIAAAAINAATTTVTGDAARIEARVVQRPVTSPIPLTAQKIRTVPGNAGQLIYYQLRGRGNMTALGLFAGITIQGQEAAGIQVGAALVIRSSSITANIGLHGEVITVTPTSLGILFTSTPTSDTNILVEVGADLSGLPVGTFVVVAEGVNAGTYEIGSLDTPTLTSELNINGVIATTTDLGGQPVFMVGDFVTKTLAIASRSQGLDTAIQVDVGVPPNPSSAAALLFSTLPQSTVGTTQWFQLPEVPGELEVGDVLELYESQFSVASKTGVIVTIEPDSRLIEVSPGLPAVLSPISFTVGSPVPFARIRKTRRDTFDIFAASASAWLAGPGLQPRWLLELDRLVTLALTEPSPPNVQGLRQYLAGLLGVVTVAGATAQSQDPGLTIEAIASAYTAPVVSEIDALVSSLLQQGGDRAVDILLDARFREYFGLDQDAMSYAGNVLAATRAVMTQDLSVSSVRRKVLADGQVTVGEFTEPDFEYDQRDIDNSAVPDSPGQNPAPSEGDAY